MTPRWEWWEPPGQTPGTRQRQTGGPCHLQTRYIREKWNWNEVRRRNARRYSISTLKVVLYCETWTLSASVHWLWASWRSWRSPWSPSSSPSSTCRTSSTSSLAHGIQHADESDKIVVVCPKAFIQLWNKKDSLSKSLWIALARGRRVVSSELTGAAWKPRLAQV